MSKKNLAKALHAVMSEAKGLEKTMKVGSGSHQYDGTRDYDVKEKYNELFVKHGLVILPIDIEENLQFNRWEETTNQGVKSKQAVFTSVKVNYLLIHVDSGEEQVVTGLGHGVDPQDKAAGKATTYALKNLLLYSTLAPVAKIDDTDNTHSNSYEVPQVRR